MGPTGPLGVLRRPEFRLLRVEASRPPLREPTLRHRMGSGTSHASRAQRPRKSGESPPKATFCSQL